MSSHQSCFTAMPTVSPPGTQDSVRQIPDHPGSPRTPGVGDPNPVPGLERSRELCLQVNVRPGQTLVLGSSSVEGSTGTFFLTVTAETPEG